MRWGWSVAAAVPDRVRFVSADVATFFSPVDGLGAICYRAYEGSEISFEVLPTVMTGCVVVALDRCGAVF